MGRWKAGREEVRGETVIVVVERGEAERVEEEVRERGMRVGVDTRDEGREERGTDGRLKVGQVKEEAGKEREVK